MSLSLPVLLAQYKIMAIGRIDAKIKEITSNSGNSHKLSIDRIKQIIKNNGMQSIGGLVKVEMLLASFNFCLIMINIKS